MNFCRATFSKYLSSIFLIEETYKLGVSKIQLNPKIRLVYVPFDPQLTYLGMV